MLGLHLGLGLAQRGAGIATSPLAIMDRSGAIITDRSAATILSRT